MGRPKKIQKVEKKLENEEELKDKIKNMATIIEELSSTAPQKGDDVDKVIDSKLNQFDERIGTQVKELKDTLIEMEKKIEKPTRVKEDVEGLLKGFEEKIHPKFSDLEQKITALSKVDNMEKLAETIKTKENKAAETAIAKEEMENLKSNINMLSKSLADMKEQLRALDRLPILERKLQVEGILDPEDVKKLEKVVSAIDEMVPRKMVDEKFKIFMDDMKEFQKSMLKSRENLTKEFTDQVVRLEERVELLFRMQKSYAEILEKKIEEMFANIQSYFEPDFEHLKRGQSFLANKKELEDLREHLDVLNKKHVELIDNLNKNVEKRALKGEMDRIKGDFDSNFDFTREYLERLDNEFYSLKATVADKEWLGKRIDKEFADLRGLHANLEKKLENFESKMESQKSLLLTEFKTVVEDKKRLQDVLNRQKEKAGMILKKLVE